MKSNPNLPKMLVLKRLLNFSPLPYAIFRVFLTQSKDKSANFNHGLGCSSLPLPAKAVLESHGIDPNGKRAVQLKASDYNKYDLFIGMDSADIRNMTRILGGNKEGKIHKLMEYTGSNADVSDPWYTRDFDRCCKDIYAGCEALIDSFNLF